MMSARLISSLKEISAKQWNRLTHNHILLSYDFLSALEKSGAVGEGTGWQACHLILENDPAPNTSVKDASAKKRNGADTNGAGKTDEAGQIIAAMPLYLKSHSQGEYVFDHGWADALERTGQPYYPKLVSAIPFTPVTHPSLLTLNELSASDKALAQKALIEASVKVMKQLHISSLHINFPTQDEWRLLGDNNFLQRIGVQFHWHNHSYRDFDDFLSTLSSRRRKTIRKERAKAKQGLVIKALSGNEITESLWDYFYDFYIDTSTRKWGAPYLNRKTFSYFGDHLKKRILLIIAEKNGTPIAGALHFIGADRLYGRYWGSNLYQPFLHFELSYYQAIDYAIAHKLKVVEAGAQGAHKIERGYQATQTFSAHQIAHSGLYQAVNHYLEDERQAINQHIQDISATSPFRRQDDSQDDNHARGRQAEGQAVHDKNIPRSKSLSL